MCFAANNLFCHGSYVGNAAYYNQAQAGNTGVSGPFQHKPSWQAFNAHPTKVPTIEDSSGTALCFEGGYYYPPASAWKSDNCDWSPFDAGNPVLTPKTDMGVTNVEDGVNSSQPRALTGWHFGRLNTLYCDGHAKSEMFEQLMALSPSGSGYASHLTVKSD